MRRAAKVDGNHAEIVRALRSAGCSVLSLASLGRGVPDLLVVRGRDYWLAEVKLPGKPLRPLQEAFRQSWGGPVQVVYSVDDALRMVGREQGGA